MEELLLILLFALVFIGIPVGIGLLLFYIPKRFGYPKTGKYLTIGYIVLIGFGIITAIFEDELFSRGDARELVEEQGIELTEEFTLEHNESMWAIGDYYHTFTLIISDSDKENAILKIKNSENFLAIGQPKTDLYWTTEDRYNGDLRTQNYETDDSFVTEYLKPNGDGYAPTYRRISIYKNSNELIFEDIDY